MFKRNVCESAIGKLLLMEKWYHIEINDTKMDFMLYYAERYSMLERGTPIFFDPAIRTCADKPKMVYVNETILDLKSAQSYDTKLYDSWYLTGIQEDLIDDVFFYLKGKTYEQILQEYHAFPEYRENQCMSYSDLFSEHKAREKIKEAEDDIIIGSKYEEWLNNFSYYPCSVKR